MSMDIFTLKTETNDNQFSYYVPDRTLTGWSSAIWTERYNDISDFKLVFKDTPNSVGLLQVVQPGGVGYEPTLLGCNASNEVMMVDTVETKFSIEHGPVIEVSGKSILDILNYRVYTMSSFYDGGPNRRTFNGDKREEYLKVVYDNDNIPQRIVDTINYYGASAVVNDVVFTDKVQCPFIAENGVTRSITKKKNELKPNLVWPMVKSMMDEYHLGIQVERIHTRRVRGSQAVFKINLFEGRDLSDRIIFAEDNNTLVSSSRLQTTKKAVNRILALGRDYSYRYDKPVFNNPGQVWDFKGFALRYGFINSAEFNNIDATIMFQENPARDILSGEVAPTNVYEYRRDYYRGDKVAFKAFDGTLTKMYVKEFIYSEDENGFKQYPTFESEL